MRTQQGELTNTDYTDVQAVEPEEGENVRKIGQESKEVEERQEESQVDTEVVELWIKEFRKMK